MRMLMVVFVIFVILLVIYGPLFFIWAINGLFGLEITYSLFHWFCAVVLLGFISGSSCVSHKRS